MQQVWSFNTTVRNPERMENMLRALAELEGATFDAFGQERFFGLQIKKRLYKPTKLILQEEDLIDAVHSKTSGDDLDDMIVERILQKYRGKAFNSSGRGRATAGILNRFGLSVARQSQGKVIITDLGKKWLTHEMDDEELFTKFLLKWQYPNPIETGYDSFNIKPFIGALSLIRKVNEKWEAQGNKPVGLSKLEYQLYITSLTKEDDIEKYATEIVNFRKEKESRTGTDKANFIKNFSLERAKKIKGTDEGLEVVLNDLADYGDSSMRYFRISGLIALRGGDTHIDIAKDKEVEVTSILSTLSAHADTFSSPDSYISYLNDTNIVLPWENEKDLKGITAQLSQVLKEEVGEKMTQEYLTKIKDLSPAKQVKTLVESVNDVRIEKLRDLKHNIEALDECINRLKSINSKGYVTLTARPSLDLEWYVSRAFMVLNDATQILPSFNLGDDGLPTGFRSNTSDIECHYSMFGMTVEVTLLLGRDQWIAEGQPVMRHFRDFEDKSNKDTSYCLFIAPIIHRDTLNTFWNGVKFNYEGKKQKIIPITLNQFTNWLFICREKILSNKLNQETIKSLLTMFIDDVNRFEAPQEWIATFPTTLEIWSKQ